MLMMDPPSHQINDGSLPLSNVNDRSPQLPMLMMDLPLPMLMIDLPSSSM